jgi:hypothetical protein
MQQQTNALAPTHPTHYQFLSWKRVVVASQTRSLLRIYGSCRRASVQNFSDFYVLCSEFFSRHFAKNNLEKIISLLEIPYVLKILAKNKSPQLPAI